MRFIEADNALGTAGHLVTSVSQENDACAQALRDMEYSSQSFPEGRLQIPGIGRYCIELEGLDEPLIECNITNAAIKRLEERTFDARERHRLTRRVPRDLVSQDRVRLVVERLCKSFLPSLSEDTLVNAGIAHHGEELVVGTKKIDQS